MFKERGIEVEKIYQRVKAHKDGNSKSKLDPHDRKIIKLQLPLGRGGNYE